jgi:4,5-DOPA dioxygenase extradiol
MKRNDFIKSMIMMPLSFAAMPLNLLSKMSDDFESTPQMPVLFLGHGSPMNAIEENAFVKGFREVSRRIPKPNAILCISAHWETEGTFVTAMPSPRTIHDFGGFPKALYDVQYPASGSPELAEITQKLVQSTQVMADYHWGLDHGAWSVIKHLFPKADVPVIQLSLDQRQPASYHYQLAKELSVLRNKGVLIVGSGNMVHNLRMVAWDKLNVAGFGFDWALEAREKMNKMIIDGNHQGLVRYQDYGRAFQLAVPSPEHYLPLLYVLAQQQPGDHVSLFNDEAVAGSLTMTSVLIDQSS